MKAKALKILGAAALAALLLAAGFEMGAKSVKVSPSESIELSGFILKGKPAPGPVRM